MMMVWCYNNSDFDSLKQVFTMIRKSEEDLHNNESEIYNCILLNYGGDEKVTERICNPEGTGMDKIQQTLQGLVDSIVRRMKCLTQCTIPWHYFDIIFGLIGLCTHLFDYVKDIGKKKYFYVNCQLIL